MSRIDYSSTAGGGRPGPSTGTYFTLSLHVPAVANSDDLEYNLVVPTAARLVKISQSTNDFTGAGVMSFRVFNGTVSGALPCCATTVISTTDKSINTVSAAGLTGNRDFAVNSHISVNVIADGSAAAARQNYTFLFYATGFSDTSPSND